MSDPQRPRFLSNLFTRMSYRPAAARRPSIGSGRSQIPNPANLASPSACDNFPNFGLATPHQHYPSASGCSSFSTCTSRGSTSVVGTSGLCQRSPSTFVTEEMRACFPGMYTRGRHRSTPYSRPNRIQPKDLSVDAKPVKNFTRNVVLLSPKDTSIPRGRARQLLYDTGRIVDMFEFKGIWNEAETMEALNAAFSKVLDPNTPTPRFQFMKACYGLLKVPNVMPGHLWTPDKIKTLSMNGDLYIQESSSISEGDDKSETEPSVLGNGDCQAGCIDERSSPSDDWSNDEDDPDIKVLRDIFPNIPLKRLHDITAHETLNTAIEILLKETTPSSDPSSLPELLNGFVSSLLNESKEMWITISKSNIWNAVLQFYKTAKANPEKMKFKLNVEFEDEEGIDAGAIKGTFFELALNEGDQRLFEGNITSRVPKKDAGLEPYLEFFGMLVVHSIVQGGPSLRNICPAVFQYIITNGDVESVTENLNFKDIPKNIATSDVISLIEKIDACNMTSELDQLLNDSTFMTIINSSRWPITKGITIESKMELLSCLVAEELIHKRLHNIQAFQRGLTCLGFLEFCSQHHAITKLLFIYDPHPLLANRFIGLLENPSKEIRPAEMTALKHFHSYIIQREGRTEGPTLAALLNFITGQSSVPPRGLKAIQIKYTAKPLPFSDCCFNIIHLPTTMRDSEQFFEAMDTAVIGAGSYFLKP